jgi:MFS family permease
MTSLVAPMDRATDRRVDLPHPSWRSLRALDWFVFFVADVQTGFGPFIAVYLTTEKWTQVDIGLVLSVTGFVALLGQVPGGALVDWARSERMVAGIAVSVIGLCALCYALWPILSVVLLASAVHAAASCVLGPAIAAISLGLVGQSAIGERFGRNARFASFGAGLSAGVMGAVGHYFDARAVFYVTAALLVPALLVLRGVAPEEIDPERAHGVAPERPEPKPRESMASLLKRRPLLIFGACIMLFHLGNAAMLPLMGSVLTMRSSQWATVMIGACLVGPQLVVAALSPWAGRKAQAWGRRPLLLAGFSFVIVRGLLFAGVNDPTLLVVVQLLDGLTGAAMSVLVPLTIADLTRGSGRFNLAQGMIGMMMGFGASLSPTLAGFISDCAGSAWAFVGLAGSAGIALLAVWLFMPETRPSQCEERGVSL